MIETGTGQLAPPARRAGFDGLGDAGYRNLVDANVWIDDGGSGSGFVGPPPLSELESVHRPDSCNTYHLRKLNTTVAHEITSVVSTEHDLHNEIAVRRLNYFAWPMDLGSHSHNTEVRWTSVPTDVDIVLVAEPTLLHPAVQAYAQGFGDMQPTRAAIVIASRIVLAALERTVEPEITVDVDGALSFDLRLRNGLLVLAELDVWGELDASVYDDRQGVLVQRLPQTTESDLTSWF